MEVATRIAAYSMVPRLPFYGATGTIATS